MTKESSNLQPLLKKIAFENNFKKPDIRVTPVSSGGANFTSQLYRATISGDGRDALRLFIKVAVAGDTVRDMTHIDIYDVERFVYTILITAYKEMEDKFRIADQYRVRFPKYYGADATSRQEILVLEDLSAQGFLLQDFRKPVDWEYASAAITQLAMFHALSLAYAQRYPQQNEKFLYKFRESMLNADGGMNMVLQSGFNKALEAVRDENKEKLNKFFKQHNMKTYIGFLTTNRRQVLMHGDFRPSNMMHKYKKDGTVELIPVDFQTLSYGSLVTDLLYFIFSATDTRTRAQFYYKLLDHYYSELGAALRRFGLLVESVYSEEDFRREYNERLPYGLLIVTIMLPIFTTAEGGPTLEPGTSFEEMAQIGTNDLYKEKLNDIVDEFIQWGVLK